MKRRIYGIAGGLAVAALTIGGTSIASADPDALETDEQDSVTFSREEEKMARDLYTALGEKYDSVVWDRIANSEQRHYDAIGRLLTTYDIADPAAGQDAGEFTDAAIQDLYDDWLERGQASEEAAFAVAIELEERDIADLKEQIEDVDNADIERVYTSLLRGSEKHLAAFTRAANGEEPLGQGPAAGRPDRGQMVGPREDCDGTPQGPREGRGMRDGSGTQLRDGSGNPDGPGDGDGPRRGPRGNR